MRAPDDRFFGPGPHNDPNPCEFHGSDSWLLVDAVVAIFTGVATIALVVLRHPYKILSFAIFLAVLGTILHWWTP